MDRRAIWLAALTTCGLLLVLLAGIVLVPHLLYPPPARPICAGSPARRCVSSCNRLNPSWPTICGRLCCKDWLVW